MTARAWPSAAPRRLLTLGWIACILAAAAILLTLAPRTFRAESQARAELARLRTISAQTDELARLRVTVAGQGGASDARQQREPLAATVSSVLAQVGLPASTLESLSPPSATAEPVNTGAGTGGINTPRLYRRRATLALGPITLPQIGRVLSTWRTAAPNWTTARIEVSPLVGGRAVPASPGADLPLRVVIALEQLDLDVPTPISSPPSPPTPPRATSTRATPSPGTPATANRKP